MAPEPEPEQRQPRPISPDELRYGQGQWALEGDDLRQHLADERTREEQLHTKRDKKKALYKAHVTKSLANPEEEARLHDYTERQQARKAKVQQHGDTHIVGPAQVVHATVFAVPAGGGIKRGQKPGRDWYQLEAEAVSPATKPKPVVFGSGIEAAAVRGTLPEERQRRKVRRADYAPPLPRVARVAGGGEEATDDMGFNRHARKPATKAKALANAAIRKGEAIAEDAPLDGGAMVAGARI